jgi:hypothetical protein
MLVMMTMVLGNVVEPEAGRGMVVILAVAPVLVGVETAARGSVAGFSAVAIKEVAVLGLDSLDEPFQIELGNSLESSLQLEVNLVTVVTVVSILIPHVGMSRHS